MPTRLLLLFLLQGCPSAVMRDPGADGSTDPIDDDAGRRADAGSDAGTPDPALQLGRTLRCELDDEQALDAMVRWVACTPKDTTTVRGLFEAWEAGLFSWVEENGGFTGGSAIDLPCGVWQCVASARSCDEADRCVNEAYTGGACEPYSRTCDGSRVERCARDGRGRAELIDCADLGGSCVEGHCEIGECVFGEGYYHLSCEDNDMVLCEGVLRMSCDAWSPGDRCGSFAVGGEVPTTWCTRADGFVAGAYDFPVECTGDVMRFESVSTLAYTFDCGANGYDGCNMRGCY
jgi:hypothetical protein